MMEADQIQKASQLLWEHWQAGEVINQLPEAIQPRSREEGYAIQAQLELLTHAPLFGWKIAATSAAGQQHIRVDGPLAGRILKEQVRPAGGTISLLNNRMRVAECEFAFKLGSRIPARVQPYSQAEVMACVASLHPAFEIPDSRFAAFEVVGAPQLIADDACAHLFVLGPATSSNWRTLDLSKHAVTAMVYREFGSSSSRPTSRLSSSVSSGTSAPEAHHGSGANVLGDPRVALTWLVNELSSLGLSLEASMVITTGTCITPIPVNAGDRVIASFGVIGEIELSFSA
jgi:2-keto-4-pentenoate hydratase